MNNLFLVLLSLIFFSFTKEKISYYENKNYGNCLDINEYIKGEISSINFHYGDYFSKIFAINAQYCRTKDPTEEYIENNPKIDKEDKCCYVSFLYQENWYYFCGKINKANYEKGVKEYIDEDLKTGENKNIFDDKKNKIKIDCLSEKSKLIIKFLFIIQLFLF